MLLYQMLPGEPLFPLEEPQTELRLVNGRLCECIAGAEGRVVSRLISTDPMDYLNPAFAPGSPVLDDGKQI
ncbi:MAG TPA: hypothetical protein IAB22_06660 [Candidatus Merdivicinus intestinavium]|nr:hypothetical protein [Candidatus Merdivicinus intestinavium]